MSGNRAVTAIATAIVLYIPACFACLLADSAQAGRSFAPFGSLIAACGALGAAGLLLASSLRERGTVRLARLLYAAGGLLIFAAEIARLLPGSSGLAWLSAAQLIPVAAALAVRARQPKRMKHAFIVMLDVAIVMSAAASLSWHYIMLPLTQAMGPGEAGHLAGLSRASLDLVLLGLAAGIRFASPPSGQRSGQAAAAAGAAVLIAADSLGLLTLAHGGAGAAAWASMLAPLSLLLLGLADVLGDGKSAEADDRPAGETDPSRIAGLRLYLPYACVSLLFLAVLAEGRGSGALPAGAFAALLLVMVRQVIVLEGNNKLLHRYQLHARELAVSSERYRSIVRHHPDAVCSVGTDGRIDSFNSGWSELTGLVPEQLLGKSFLDLLERSGLEEGKRLFLEAMEGLPAQRELAVAHADGRRLIVGFTAIPVIVGGRVQGVYCIGKDITEARRNEDRIRYLAFRDPLTGLANRRHFEEAIAGAITETREGEGDIMAAVLYLDLDRFKLINDTLGHEVGDELLASAANRLAACAGEAGLAARQGGDEFTLLLRNVRSEAEAAAAAQRVLDMLGEEYEIQGHRLKATPSIGVALYPVHAGSPSELLRLADVAMYRVKEGGKNGYALYRKEWDAEEARRLTLEAELPLALANGQLYLHYQPQFDSQTASVIGAEALLRWNHPREGQIPPETFIPVAEQNGFIVELGEWVLRQACAQARQWHDAGHKIRIGVNLSPRQLERGDLAERVGSILRESGLNPRYLVLEITEGIAVDGVAGAADKLLKLKALGINLSVDDFGTGFSALSCLTRLPVDTLKVPREFIANIGNDPADEAMIATIVALSRSLRLHVAAEGIETEKQSRFLQRAGFDILQGFYYGPPVSGSVIGAMLEGETAGRDSEMRLG